MRLCIATNWQDDYLRELAKLAAPGATVFEVFGALPRSIAGTGRDAGIVPSITPEGAARHIALAHSLGFRFNYLVNGSCMGGAEFTPDGRQSLEEYLAWIRDVGADAITVAIPLVLELARKIAPDLELVVSTIAHVDSLRSARMFEELGADRINVSLMVNRDFRLLTAMRKHVRCDLELLANEMCLYGCPYRDYHYSLMAHASQAGRSLATVEYPHLKCTSRRMAHPGDLLKARFIRPEDVARYEEVGIDLIKIAGRGKGTPDLLRIARAYLSRRYDGNFIDLTDLGLYDVTGAKRPRIVLDNRALDGFLEKVAAVDCDRACGNACTICDTLATDLVSIHDVDDYRAGLTRAYDSLLAPRTVEHPATGDVAPAPACCESCKS
jgi:collagenase-like PrtC family protease